MPPLAEAVVLWQWVLGQFAGEGDSEMMVPFGGAVARDVAVLDGTICSAHQERLILKLFVSELYLITSNGRMISE
jgi:hypothetical protein